MIAPEHTKINGKISLFDHISIVLENGNSYPIAEVVRLLERDDKKRSKRRRTGRVGRFVKAFKTAVQESVDESGNDDGRMAVKHE